MRNTHLLCCLVLSLCATAVICATDEEINVVNKPPAEPPNRFYVGNRPPLLPSALIKLPTGSIEPRGWLRTQLELQADGFVGHLAKISKFLKKEDNAWLSKDGQGHSPWEEVPYWLKGFGDTGYVLGDQRIIDEARQWLEAVIASQREDGYFGPRSNLTNIHTEAGDKPDLWPNMIMLNALQSYYDYGHDERVLKLMTKYFRWQLQIPDADLLLPFWQQQRAADNLASVYWLYNRTGEPWLLDLAHMIHRNTAPWTEKVASWHGVNIAQCFRGPANYYVQSKNPKHLRAAQRNYDEVMGIYGQVPGGMFGADENCRPGFTGPRQAAETCSMVEFMLSFEMLLAITGEAKWADRCEEVAFNSLPAAMTSDLKALHYLTAPNLILADRANKSPGLQNRGAMLSYNPHRYRCCQHNVAHGWPYFAEHLWMATPDNGLAAVLYSPCRVKAKVGNGVEVAITEDTIYPFDENIQLRVSLLRPVRFPLYLRMPGWCDRVGLSLNGEALPVAAGLRPGRNDRLSTAGEAQRTTGPTRNVAAGLRPGRSATETPPGSYLVLDRTWSDGDKVLFQPGMSVRVTRWEENHDSVSVSRGPLTYSLKIGENAVRAGGTDDWPAWEIHPTTPWNYGLVLDAADPTSSFEVVLKLGLISGQPFKFSASPIELRARARKMPAWKKDYLGLVGPLQDSPVRSDQPVETVTLIPMGCARLRISAFPVIGDGPDAHEWLAPPTPAEPTPARASHCWRGDTVAALSDELLPKSSADRTIPRFTWWDHRGTTEWVQYDFGELRKLSRVEVYWFDDRGGCRPPASWRLLYKVGDDWQPVSGASEFGVEVDRFNVVTFDPVQTDGLRIEVQLQEGVSAGILEWRVR